MSLEYRDSRMTHWHPPNRPRTRCGKWPTGIRTTRRIGETTCKVCVKKGKL